MNAASEPAAEAAAAVHGQDLPGDVGRLAREEQRGARHVLRRATALERGALDDLVLEDGFEIALGVKPSDAMDRWPEQYSWWLKHRETALAQVRRDIGETA